ncbi:MAG: signal peptidase II [Candidatus Omnitrophota bacterium]
MPGKIREKISFFLFSLLIFLLDILSKRLVLNSLFFGESIPVIRGIFHISLVANTGTAFGLFKGLATFFTLFSIIAVIAIIYILSVSKNLNRLYNFALSLILAGALGNLLDRIIYGFVVDFLDFRIWPVFNVADSAITIGVGLLIYKTIFIKEKISDDKFTSSIK